MSFNTYGVWAIYKFEIARTLRTIWGSIATPVISTSLYFVVFGGALASRIHTVGGVDYGAFIVPGLIMLLLMTESISNASFGIYMPKFTGTKYEILSAPISAVEIIIGYVGAAATKSVVLGLIVLITASFFTRLDIQHPVWVASFLLLTSIAFSMFGFIIGIWAKSFEQLSFIPMLIVMPLSFLGGAFYSIDMLSPVWRTVSLFNPVVYLVSGFRWAFFDKGDVSVAVSLAFTALFLTVCLSLLIWIFRTGYRLKE